LSEGILQGQAGGGQAKSVNKGGKEVRKGSASVWGRYHLEETGIFGGDKVWTGNKGTGGFNKGL